MKVAPLPGTMRSVFSLSLVEQQRQTSQNNLLLVSGREGLGASATKAVVVGCMIVLRLRLSRILKHHPCGGKRPPVTPSRLLTFMPFPKILRIVSG